MRGYEDGCGLSVQLGRWMQNSRKLSKESDWGDSEDSLGEPLPTHGGWRDGPVRSSKWH